MDNGIKHLESLLELYKKNSKASKVWYLVGLGLSFVGFGVGFTFFVSYFYGDVSTIMFIVGLLLTLSSLTALIICTVFLTKILNAKQKIPEIEKQIEILKQSKSVANEKQSKIDEKAQIDLLVKYKKLLDSGVITKEEFEEKKKKLL